MTDPSSSAPTPAEIARALEERLIGQRSAVREMSVALGKHLAGVSSGNILMIGSSGTGKTTLMRAVEQYLASDPELAASSTVVRLHANVLAQEAERGRPGEAVLGLLLERAREVAREATGAEAGRDDLLRRVMRGIVFIDEVDKIRARVGDGPNVAGIRAQEALLTLIENESVPFRLPEWAGGGTVRLDSSGLLFVAAGAFEGLYDAVYDRVTIGRDRGSLQPVTRVREGGEVSEEHSFDLRDWLRNEDLFDYGMTPQFLSRFDAVVLLDDLTVDDLVKIFLSMPDSGYQQSRAYFVRRGIHLALSPAAVRKIAQLAARQPRLGARALRDVFRRVIRDFEFDPDSAPSGADGALLIDVAEVEARA